MVAEKVSTYAHPVETLVLHPGVFHADDVLCAAMVRELFPAVSIIRTADKAMVESAKNNYIFGNSTIVADIGGGIYDHHQKDVPLREDGEKRAACGLIFEDIREILFPTGESANHFEQSFIIPIEDGDNGVSSNPLSASIFSFVPSWDSSESMDEAFFRAVDFMQAILKREIARAEAELRARDLVEDACAKAEIPQIIVLPQFAPWQEVLCGMEGSLFVIFPGARGGFNLQCVPVAPNSFQQKQALPENWLTNKPEGCTFVHANRFLAVFATEEQAVNAAKSLLVPSADALKKELSQVETEIKNYQSMRERARGDWELYIDIDCTAAWNAEQEMSIADSELSRLNARKEELLQLLNLV